MENKNRPRKQFTSFFDNNVNYSIDKNDLVAIRRVIDALDRRIKKLEDDLKKIQK